MRGRKHSPVLLGLLLGFFGLVALGVVTSKTEPTEPAEEASIRLLTPGSLDEGHGALPNLLEDTTRGGSEGPGSTTEDGPPPRGEPVSIWVRLQSVLGLFLLLAFAWAISTNRKLIPWRVIGWGLGIQLVFAVLILKTAPGIWIFKQLNTGV
ncbi:MAG: Na+ dependent nucleoside transporter N-terminal domain-containing protein, partial [Myxococcota bacterium]|nr:Na+ dependent nucleoside transporter N-terminal domain-containing protein [Myxococcota bacterium]